jgi:RNA polymerase sigma-70 factor (ECF subfamily)
MRPLRHRDPLANPEELIRRVYAYAAHRLGAGPDAEDVTSEVFERAIRYRKSYDPSKGEPVTWLLGIAQRCANTALAGRASSQADLVETGDGTDLEDDSVRRLSVRAAMAGLGSRDRELIALRYGADLTAAQIGAILDLQPNAVEVALHRALSRLRHVLDAENEDESASTPRASGANAR